MAWYNFFMSNMSIWAQVLDRTGFSWVFKSFDQYPTDTDPEYRIETSLGQYIYCESTYCCHTVNICHLYRLRVNKSSAIFLLCFDSLQNILFKKMQHYFHKKPS